MLPCPRCRSHLHGVRTPAGTVWDCPRGHGRFAMLPVLRDHVRRIELDAAWRAAFWGAPRPGCACPSCGRAMAEVAVAGLALDVCRRCQALWLDRPELDALPPAERPVPPPPLAADARAALARAQVDALQRRHQLGEPIGDAPDEGWKRALGALGLPVEIGAMAPRTTPWATWGLCAALLAVAAAAGAGGLDGAIAAWGFVPAEPLRHGGLTWITAFFIHAGVLHLLGNLWFLWLAGDNVEDELGWRRYLLLIAIATLAGSLLHLAVDPRPHVPCVGASGGISGVMAAYALRYPQAQIGLAWHWGAFWLRLPAWLCMGLWLLGQGVLAWQQVAGFGNVSAMAHLGGAAAGAVLAWRWGRRRG